MAETIFLNADYIVIDYMDILAMPWLTLLNQISKNPKLKEILKIEEIEYLEPVALLEWYMNRKHRNFFLDLKKDHITLTDKEIDSILEDQMNYNEQLYSHAICLPMMTSIIEMKKRKLTKDILIYDSHHNDHAKRHIKEVTKLVLPVYHDFDEIMKKAGSNSTYFLSDVDLIPRMAEKGVLKHSCVSVPVEYRYNKKDLITFKLDFDKLYNEHPFKLSYFKAITGSTSN